MEEKFATYEESK